MSYKKLIAAQIIYFLCAAGITFAQSNAPTLVGSSNWHANGEESQLHLNIDLAKHLTKKQQQIITSGFTSLVQINLNIIDPKGQKERIENAFYKLRCSVKYDSWEEFFDVTRLLEATPKTLALKSEEEFNKNCLFISIPIKALPGVLTVAGGSLFSSLIVKQTSQAEAQKIRENLLEQQSGVMQRLFSHMLGELTLNEKTEIIISVPPPPITDHARSPKKRGKQVK